MKILNINNFNDFKNILENNNNFILNVSATWCKPCQNIKNDLENFISNLNSLTLFIKLDYDIIEQDDSFNEYFTIDKVPTFIIFENSLPKSNIISSDLNLIKEFIQNNLSENNSFIIDENF